MDEEKIDRELKKIWDEAPISHSNSEKEACWEQFKTKTFSSKEKKLKPWRYYAAAAAILIALVGTGIYLNSGNSFTSNVTVSENVIENPTSILRDVVLPDSSRVVLSPNSKITYADNFALNRKVEVAGQVYFKVKKDKKHPFQVTCNETTTTVLGTSFTVAENSKKEVTVELYEGSVEMSLRNNNKKWILKPGEKFTYGNNTGLVTEFSRFIDFDNDKLSFVGSYIESAYGYKVIVPAEYSNQRITLRINKKEELKTIVQLISDMYNLNFEVNEKLKQITFQ